MLEPIGLTVEKRKALYEADVKLLKDAHWKPHYNTNGLEEFWSRHDVKNGEPQTFLEAMATHKEEENEYMESFDRIADDIDKVDEQVTELKEYVQQIYRRKKKEKVTKKYVRHLCGYIDRIEQEMKLVMQELTTFLRTEK